MSIQCGICKNVMPSASFMEHKERKHSLLVHVPFVKLMDDEVKKVDLATPVAATAAIAATAATAAVALVKCRFCRNRLPKGAMERHLQRRHVDCHLCGKTLLKSKQADHIKQMHGHESSAADATTKSDGNLRQMADLSQSKLSIQSDCDASIATAASNLNLSPARSTRKPFQSSLSSSWSSLLSSTPSPLSSSRSMLQISSSKPEKPTIQPQHQAAASSPPSSSAKEPVIHVDIWQLAKYKRQGRVYESNGWLYLRSSSVDSMHEQK